MLEPHLEIKETFKVHDTSTGKENLQQIICNTAKEWFEKSNVEMNLFGSNNTKMSKSAFGLTDGRNVEKMFLPMTV